MWNEALENLQKSAELNPRQYMAQFVLGQSSVMTGQFEDAERPLDAAIAIDPVNVYAHRWKVFLLLNRGADIEQARQVLQDAFRIAPMDDKWFDSQGPQRLFPEEYQQRFSGIRLAGSGLDSALYYRTMAETYFAQGETDVLRAYADSLLLVERPRRAFNHLFLAFAYAALDSTDRALEEIDIAMAGDEYRTLIRHGYTRLNPLYWMATVYTMVGEYDKAIDQLELLVSGPTWHSANVARIDPTWAPLRSHPRFQALLERYGN
jgi:predicted Zn-dependent protease